jgi:endonuclease YncB( thermonuclease family)
MRAPFGAGRRYFRRPSTALMAFGVVALVAIGAAVFRPAAAPISGRADVIDGDTLRIGAVRVRLTGLDAPEIDQTCTDASGRDWGCGREAKAYLADLADKRLISCRPSGRDRYGRTLAKCAADAADLGAAIVTAGWAVIDFDYVAEQADAQLSKRGIWSGAFVAPAEWRRTHGSDQTGLWEWIRAWFQ